MLCARQIDFFLCQRTWFAATLLWLNGVPASHTGVCQTLSPAGLPKLGLLAGLEMTAWKPLAYPGHSLGSFPPWGLTFNWKEVKPRAKAKPDMCKRKSGKNLCLGEMGCSHTEGSAHWWRGETGVGFNFETWHADLQPKGHLNFCLKLMKKQASVVVAGERAFPESVTIPFILSFLQKRELGPPVLTLITYYGDNMSQRQPGLVKWISKWTMNQVPSQRTNAWKWTETHWTSYRYQIRNQ